MLVIPPKKKDVQTIIAVNCLEGYGTFGKNWFHSQFFSINGQMKSMQENSEWKTRYSKYKMNNNVIQTDAIVDDGNTCEFYFHN